MDRYRFPLITHISQCLRAIEGCDSFYVAERDRHTIINYHAMGNDTFPPVFKPSDGDGSIEIGFSNDCVYYDADAAIRRECRGIVFGPDGRVIARRLHKFFNFGERPEVARVDVNMDAYLLEKLDGSMITPIPIGDTIRWGTKLGLTEVGFQAEEFVSTRENYLKMAEHFRDWKWTPIFEWCSRKQRIVVDYPHDQLVLIAMRHNETGEYLSYEFLKTVAHFWDVPVVQPLEGWNGSSENGTPIEDLILDMASEDTGGDKEGYVLRFNDGHAVKIKYPDYVRIHRAKDSILQEKRVVEIVLNEKVDDVLPHLIDHDRKALSDFQMDFWRGVLRTKTAIWGQYSYEYRNSRGDKKTFALSTTDLDPQWRSVMFSIWGTRPEFSQTKIFEELRKRVGKHLGSQTSIDGVRWIWGGIKWLDYLHQQSE